MRLNLGCGFAHIAGYINVDSWGDCAPDVVCDLENEIWPFEDNSAKFVFFDHSLEHMGETTEQFFHVMKELYRICAPNAEVAINVPHPLNRLYTNDPTHVRPIYPETLGMFSQDLNRKQIGAGMKNSKLGLQTETDFEILSIEYVPDGRLGKMSEEELDSKLLAENNVVAEIRFRLRAVKPNGVQ